MAKTSEAPWLDVMVSRLGTKELPGTKNNNAAIIKMFADVGHPEIRTDETAWCAAAMGSALVACDMPIPPKNMNLMARSYLTLGKRTIEPKRGAIAVWPRGNSKWQGHVNCVEQVRMHRGKLQVRCIGGNQSNAMTRTSWMYASKALDFRWPVAPTVKELRKAGSTEIKSADNLEAGSAVTAGTAIVGAIANKVSAAPVVVPAPPPVAVPAAGPAIPLDAVTPEKVTEQLGTYHKLMEAGDALVSVALKNPWLAAAVVASLVGLYVARRWKKDRVKRHQMGLPLSVEAANVVTDEGGDVSVELAEEG